VQDVSTHAQSLRLRGVRDRLARSVDPGVAFRYPPTVDFTGGCYFFLGRSVLGMAAGTPLTGPKPYAVGALVDFNYIF
jgi:hypothetical protein